MNRATVAPMAKHPKPEKRPPGRPPRRGEAAETRVSVRVTDAELEAWTRAAGEQSLGEWIRDRCNRAAARSS